MLNMFRTAIVFVFIACQQGESGHVVPRIEPNRQAVETANTREVLTSLEAGENCHSSGLESVQDVFWSGKVGRSCIFWSRTDLVVKEDSEKGTISFWREPTEKQYDRWKEDNTTLRCDYGRDFKLLAVFGSFITFFDQESIVCGTASHHTNVLTVDLAKTKSLPTLNSSQTVTERIGLRRFFSEFSIFEGMLESSELSTTIRSLDPHDRPSDLDELLTLTEQRDNKLLPADYALNSDLSEFAFSDIENGMIVVRLFLMPTSGYNSTSLRYFDIRLPIPPELAVELSKSAAGNEGFLLNGRELGMLETTRFLRTR